MPNPSTHFTARTRLFAIALVVSSSMLTVRELSGGADETIQIPDFNRPALLGQAYLDAERASRTLQWIEVFLKSGPASDGDLGTISD
jgi:hypothetical protein